MTLFGQQCRKCGHIGFPQQIYGCETCGAYGKMLAPQELEAIGLLISFAEVHRYQGREIEAPFVIGEIRLQSGPLLRCTLDQRGESGLYIGAEMCGSLTAPTGERPSELRFRLARD
ncbi:MAG: hypothetical protein WDN01_22540 [Rhizomicrobium sp.]